MNTNNKQFVYFSC